MNRLAILQVLVAAAFVVAACDGARDTELDDQGVTHLTEPAEPVDDEPAEDRDPGTSSGSSSGSTSSGSSGTPSSGCAHRDAIDHDGDGLSYADGDCNDCDAKIRPGKIDVPGNGVDEDCSGKADDDAACDGALALGSSDPMDGARAIGLCRTVAPNKAGAGVVSAKYVKPDGTPLTVATSWGILDSFGASNAPTQGKQMLALSTGSARVPGHPEYAAPSGADKGYAHGTPAGWPKASPSCPGIVPSAIARDGAALELTVKVPIDAHAMSFDHALFTFEYSAYVCSQYTDSFVVIMDPPPAGAVSGNVVFDAQGGPIGVNSPLLQVCAPGTFNGITFACGQGNAGLTGTGFEGHAATGWLRTTVPVAPGSTVKMLFAVWDSGDGVLDTTILLDALRFWSQPVAKVQTVPK